MKLTPSTTSRIKRCLLFKIISQYPIEPTEFFLGLLSLCFGLWLVNPFADTFNTVSTYRYITTLIPEPLLGVVMSLLGLIRIKALLYDNASLRRFIGLLGNVVWLFLSIGAFMGNPAATAVPVFGVVSLVSLWIYLRLPLTNKQLQHIKHKQSKSHQYE